MAKHLLTLLLSFFIAACSQGESGKRVITIQASSVPQAEILEQIKEDLEKEGIALHIRVIDDYNIPNRALAEGEIDANFFQHEPFLQEQIKQFNYPLATLVEVHIEPMGIYSKNESLNSLKKGSLITLPSDPTNEERALLLLKKAGLITLKKSDSFLTILDIEENPLGLKFKEVDSAFLTRTLDEVDAAVIPTNYALLIGLSPLKDALLLEDTNSPYANIIAIKEKDRFKPDLIALKRHMESEKMKLFIETAYKGSLIPLLKEKTDLEPHLETLEQELGGDFEATHLKSS